MLVYEVLYGPVWRVQKRLRFHTQRAAIIGAAGLLRTLIKQKKLDKVPRSISISVYNREKVDSNTWSVKY